MPDQMNKWPTYRSFAAVQKTASGLLRLVPSVWSLALIGNASADERCLKGDEAFSIRRLEGRRWRLRRTLATV